MTSSPGLTADYTRFIEDLKQRVAAARLSAARAVNRDLIALYWDIGQSIVHKQQTAGWGQSVVERIARNLRAAFLGTQGFSARNVWDMRRLYEEYTQPEFLRQLVAEEQPARPARAAGQGEQRGVTRARRPSVELLRQLVAEIPWGQHLLILGKLEGDAQRLYYLRATAAYGWSRNVLLNQVKAGAWERSRAEGKSHNFPKVLQTHLAEQAQEARSRAATTWSSWASARPSGSASWKTS